MVECSRYRTNIFFGFLLENGRFKGDDIERFKNIQAITVWLWNLFNITNSYLEFRDTIIQSELYMDKYNSTYQQIYSDYCRYEKERKDSRIEHFFNKEMEWEK